MASRTPLFALTGIPQNQSINHHEAERNSVLGRSPTPFLRTRVPLRDAWSIAQDGLHPCQPLPAKGRAVELGAPDSRHPRGLHLLSAWLHSVLAFRWRGGSAWSLAINARPAARGASGIYRRAVGPRDHQPTVADWDADAAIILDAIAAIQAA